MIGFVRNRIGFKVSLVVTIFLSLFIAVGFLIMADRELKNLEQQFISRGKYQSIIGAKSISRIFEEAIDNGVLTLADVTDVEYEEIEGFEPPKYHTKYDFYTDKALLSLQDEFLKDTSMIYAVSSDINGYIPTHNLRFQQPITGNYEKDMVGNRTKRIFDDEVGINAARNKTEGYHQIYYRDTGEILWDFSTPIIVKGKHWGGFRVGYSTENVKQAKSNLKMSFLITMIIFTLLSASIIFTVINIVLRPLRTMTEAASRLADGNLGTAILIPSKDELGQLGDVLERLRMGMNAAIKRLKKK